MKKIILFTVLTLVFASCSSNENNISADSLTGVWKITQNVYNNEEVPLKECQENDFTEMFSNKTFKAQFHEKINNECVNNDDSQGTWKYINGNNYTLSVGQKTIWLTLVNFNTLKTQEDKNDDTSYEILKLQ